ncbi:alpha-D-xyloside xylohydrolase [Klenkia soli]|uniref:Alpha-D-xyloside xylohydrolase n=1 Tax=Klenkia soli TaxID=1052260 RepID=A0A1H0U5W8_9ACTN|nr:TIM-barrel domain-containing protein [Klenkia soli]SDP61677.1 alpha-D-xyloside xylohydrolase [Klenkia soli]
MSDQLTVLPDRLAWVEETHRLEVVPWGPDAVRVRAAVGPLRDGLLGALELPVIPGEVRTQRHEDGTATLTHGRLQVRVDAVGELTFTDVVTGVELLREERTHFSWPRARNFTDAGGGLFTLSQNFAAHEDEKLFGLGQHQHGLFDQKGAVVELVQRNAEVSIPFLVSSRGYGFLWNNPALGRVELGRTGTRWIADAAQQIDYWVTAGPTPADVLQHYGAVTGTPPEFPDWASGFWQSKLRYRSQDELLAVARRHHELGLPMSVIVNDFFHWRQVGDWDFDAEAWPDPEGMVAELAEMGVRLLTSVWPLVSPLSRNFEPMRRQGFLTRTRNGMRYSMDWVDRGVDRPIGASYYDAFDPGARAYVWGQVKQHYYDRGLRTWWLDACEPEVFPGHHHNFVYAAGTGSEVANAYPREHVRGFDEAMRAEGETAPVMLIRSAWAGSQRFGALLWSGDVPTTWASLRNQVVSALNVGLSGISWWNSDIGGFHGGHVEDPDYRELLVRWFQFSVFCPVLRLHGDREPRIERDAEVNVGPDMTGGPNEVWSYGPEVQEVLTDQLQLRERVRPYLHEQMAHASATGVPPMRALFLQFPDDPRCWEVEDQFLLGPDVLVAPVLAAGVRERSVYLPAGADWVDAWDGTEHAGGTTVTVAAPLDRIPVLLRAGSGVDLRG